jgi:hypothetical protein
MSRARSRALPGVSEFDGDAAGMSDTADDVARMRPDDEEDDPENL